MKKILETNNPYTLQFSYVPPRLIERSLVTSEIMENYTRAVPTYRGMFITGVRGSGKTVTLGTIRNRLAEFPGWITVDLNPESNLLDSLAHGLYLIPELKRLFVKAKLDFSLLGIGIHLKKAELIASNEEDALKMMLQVLKSAKKKLLITIDEVTYNKDVAKFSHALSSFANADYDIYVLMTGLTENIKSIKNQKSLTFLYRAKVEELDTLNLAAIRADYQDTLGLDKDFAEVLAAKTRGYSLAFQALGYHFWQALCRSGSPEKVDLSKIDRALDTTLSELAYDKIWDELSVNDKMILNTMLDLQKKNEEKLLKVADIRSALDMNSDTFTKYRQRLLDSGVVDGSQYGYLRFKLPRFEQYIYARRLLE